MRKINTYHSWLVRNFSEICRSQDWLLADRYIVVGPIFRMTHVDIAVIAGMDRKSDAPEAKNMRYGSFYVLSQQSYAFSSEIESLE